MFWIPMAIGAGAGLLKNNMEQGQANAERRRQAETTRYSPWTGMHGTAVKDPSLFGNLATGAASGAMIGQAMGAGATPPTGGETMNPTGAGQTTFSLSGEQAGNTAPFQLGTDPNALASAGQASKYNLGGSAGAFGGQNPWAIQGPNDLTSFYQKMYKQGA